jgi:5-methylcytosine-specific restriction endonuclease McrA
VFADEPEAYFASAHWARRTKAQLARAPACEVERCGGTTELRVQHLQHDSLGAERAGADLATLCAGCHRRARRRSLELGRLLTRDELRALDPEAPLFDPDAIAALRERYDLS